MLKLLNFLGLLLFLTQVISAQIDDKFDYDSIVQNVAWTGDIESFVISNNRLRSDHEQTNSTFYISRPTSHSTTTEWLIKMELQFNTSSANYVDWFLMADSNNLTKIKNAYFVRIGNTADEVSLYKISNGQAPQILINGTDGILNRSNNTLSVRVLRYPDGKWSLSVNTQGLLEPMSHEGDTTDIEFEYLPYTGVLIRQSTASFFKKHFFELFYMGKEIRDSIPPKLISSEWINGDSIHLVFNEKLDSITALDVSNYKVTPSLSIDFINLYDNKSEVGIRLSSPLSSLNYYNLNLSGIKDVEGNKMEDTSIQYLYLNPEPALPFDLVVNEIMATPSPSVGLPEYRYIELYNRSNKVIDLDGFTLYDRSSKAVLNSFLILPDSFVILCPNNAVHFLSEYGNCLGVTSFPVLNKTSDEVLLYNPNKELIHSIFYTDEWYGDKIKKNGGFSLEMIDVENPCSGYENWSASQSALGGTPGRHNSIQSKNPDYNEPVLFDAYSISDDLIELRFSEQLDSFLALTKASFHFDESELNPSYIVKNSFGRVQLRLPKPMKLNKIYSLTVNGFEDCAGNTMKKTTVRVGKADKVQKGDLLVNEILFNPPQELSEFVEIYNNSTKIIDLKEIRLGNLKDDGSIRDFINPIPEGYLIFPKQYIAFSTSGDELCDYYICEAPENIIKVKNLPSYPQKSGGVVLADYIGLVIDSFQYNEKMHFQLISNPKGVSLERIEFDRPSTDQSNWTSASGNSGFATPGYENSQAIQPTIQSQKVWLDTEVFSPDGDGVDDKLNIRYNLGKSEYVANVYIYNVLGVFITQAVSNLTLSSSGVLSWDGFYNNTIERCPIGIYIVIFEAFNKDGSVVKEKFSCTVTGRW